MIRVCFVEMQAMRLSGSQQSLINLIEELQKYDVEPFIVCRAKWELIDVAKSMNIKTFVLPSKGLIIPNEGLQWKTYIRYPAKKGYNFWARRKAVQFLIQNKIDIVHLNTTFAPELWAEAAKIAGIPYIWHIREFLDLDHQRIFMNKKHSYNLIRQANHVIAISKAVQLHWVNRLKIEIDLIYNGLPVKEYYSEHIWDSEQQELKCLMVGRIKETKGQMEAVKAVEELKKRGVYNVRLTLVGYRGIDEYELMLANYIKEHQLEQNVKLVDYTYDMTKIRNNHDVGLTCSKAEAFGRVTVENMMAGLVVVGSNTGGTPELIEHGKTGYLYDYGNPDNLADQLEYIANHRSEAEEIAKSGQEQAIKKFNIERTANEVYQIYLRTLKEG